MASPSQPAPAAVDPGVSRALASRVVVMVTGKGRTLDTALKDVLGRTVLSPRDRGLVRELSFGTVRWFDRLGARVERYLNKPLKPRDADIRALLLVGLYQLEFLRVPSHAAVDATVRSCHVLGKPWARGLVNAVLRKAARDPWPPSTLPDAILRSHPHWLYQLISTEWPQYAQTIMDANNNRPPMTLRVNQRCTSRSGYLARLQAAGLTAHSDPRADTAIVLDDPVSVEQLPGFAEGWVSVQDIAAQWVADVVAAQPGERVLDACAAPGGKMAHLLEREPSLELHAVDRDPQRVTQLYDTLERLNLRAEVFCADAADPGQWWDGTAYQRILIDAPCTGSGVIRRHPDIKHLRRPQDISGFCAQQGRLLDALWPLLAPGGRLVYVTCSVLRAENDGVIEAFLQRTPAAAARGQAAVRQGIATGFGSQVLPGVHEADGFYYACLQHKL